MDLLHHNLINDITNDAIFAERVKYGLINHCSKFGRFKTTWEKVMTICH